MDHDHGPLTSDDAMSSQHSIPKSIKRQTMGEGSEQQDIRLLRWYWRMVGRSVPGFLSALQNLGDHLAMRFGELVQAYLA